MSTTFEVQDINDRRARLKSNLGEWKEVVIRADGFLGWEQDWYPAVTGGILTASFLFIWYWDPTLLTFIAFMGLMVTLADFLGPKIINKVYGADSWNGVKEKKYDEVVEEIMKAMDNVEAAFRYCREARGRKPVVHFVATVTSLVVMAWLGNRINNFFLAYLLTLSIAMLPGLHRRGILHKHFALLTAKFGELVKGSQKKME